MSEVADLVAADINSHKNLSTEARRRSVQPQTYYWNTFTIIKVDQFYFQKQEERLDRIEFWLNIFTALTSSAAVGGWLIWQNAPIVWASIIGASNVLTAIRPLLPFRKSLKAIETLSPEIDALALQAERDWWSVARGKLSEDEILKLVEELLRRRSVSASASFKGLVFRQNDKCLRIAEKCAIAYMNGLTEE